MTARKTPAAAKPKAAGNVRAPRKQRPAPTRDKLDAAGLDAILTMITEGVTYRQIAAKYEMGVARLCAWMEADVERSQACARAREASAQSYEEMAEEDIQNASDVFELSKARELAIHRRWRAKVVNPKKYGDRQHIDVNDVTPKSDEEIDAALARMLSKVGNAG